MMNLVGKYLPTDCLLVAGWGGGGIVNYTAQESENTLTGGSKLTSQWGTGENHVPPDVTPLEGHITDIIF